MESRSQRLPLQPGLSCKAKTIFCRFAGWDESVLTLLLMGVPGVFLEFLWEARYARRFLSGSDTSVSLSRRVAPLPHADGLGLSLVNALAFEFNPFRVGKNLIRDWPRRPVLNEPDHRRIRQGGIRRPRRMHMPRSGRNFTEMGTICVSLLSYLCFVLNIIRQRNIRQDVEAPLKKARVHT